MSREYKYARELIKLLNEGVISKDLIIDCCLSYMSDDDVLDMMERNDIIGDEELEEE
jgi:hypothetical protein